MESTNYYINKIRSIEKGIQDRQKHLEDYLVLSYLLFTNNDLAGYREASREILDDKKKKISADIYTYCKMISDFKTELRLKTNSKSIKDIDIDEYNNSSEIVKLFDLIESYEVKIKHLKKEVKMIDLEKEELSFRSEDESKRRFISRYKSESDYFLEVINSKITPTEQAILNLMQSEDGYKLLLDSLFSVGLLNSRKETLRVNIPVNLDTLISNTDYFKKRFNFSSNVLTLDFSRSLLLSNNIKQELSMLKYLNRKLSYYSDDRLNNIVAINHTSIGKVDNLIASYNIPASDKDFRSYQELLKTYDDLKAKVSKSKKSKTRVSSITFELNNHSLLKVSRSIIELVINNARRNHAKLLESINQKYGTTKIDTLVNELELFLDSVNNGTDEIINTLHELDNGIADKVSLLESKTNTKLDLDYLLALSNVDIPSDKYFEVYESSYSKSHAQMTEEKALTRLSNYKKKEKPKVYELL